MAVYRCQMAVTMEFFIKADDEFDALEWINTHDFKDVEAETTYYDLDFNDQVLYEDKTGEVAGIDISTFEE